MLYFNREWEVKELRLKEVFTISRSSRSAVPVVFLKLTRDGITGYGEASPNTRYDESPEKVIAGFKKLPTDFFDEVSVPEDIAEKLSGFEAVQSAKAAIEMAWMDWWGKYQNQSLWKLWGYDAPIGPVTSYTIGIDTPKKMQDKIRAASGFPVYKIKLGTDHDRELVEAIREVTDKPLRVDANEGWKTTEQALQEIEYLAEQDVELVEQPMPSSMLQEMKELKKQSPLPLCADESFIGAENLEELSEAFDVLNIKLMKIGSLVKARQVIRQAHDLGMQIMIGCMIESSLANAAGALVALDVEYCDLDGHILIGNDPFKGFGLNDEKSVVLSDNPGLGVQERT